MNPLRVPRSVLLLLICATLVMMGNISSAATPRLTGTLRTNYFTVHYNPSDPFAAKLMARAARGELLRISRDLGYKPDAAKPFAINLYSTHYDFIEAGGLQTHKFTVGTARSGDELISVDASGAFVSAQMVLAHEITHAIIFRILGNSVGALPLWMNEGLAKYESDDYSRSDKALLADAAANGALISLSELEKTFPEKQDSLAYAESAAAATYLVKTAGASAPRVYLAELARTGSADAAMRKAAEKSEESFANVWIESTGGKYGTLRITGIITSLLSVFMALLVVAAFLVRRKQKIEAARRWEEEEFDEFMRRELRDWRR